MRSTTPNTRNSSGGTTVKMQRACNGCGSKIGDVTHAEMQAAVNGEPLPDARGDCPLCSWRQELAHPERDDVHLNGEPAVVVPRAELAWLLAQVDSSRADFLAFRDRMLAIADELRRAARDA